MSGTAGPAASRQLHISQAALTKSLRQLEEDAGVPLLVRSPRGVSLTEASQRLFARARLVTRQLDLAIVAETGDLPEGEFHSRHILSTRQHIVVRRGRAAAADHVLRNPGRAVAAATWRPSCRRPCWSSPSAATWSPSSCPHSTRANCS